MTSNELVPDDLRRFLESNVDSIEQLELLRLCGEKPDKLWSFADMAGLIQTSLDRAGDHIFTLERRGLLRIDRKEATPRCGLALLAEDRWRLVSRLLALYNERPVTLIKWVYARAQDPLRAFADAFRIRKGGIVEGAVYLLCAATALACSLLMLRGWLRTRVPLLLAVAIAFGAFTVENAILFADVVLFPNADLSWVRGGFALLGVTTLLSGLIWGTK